MKIILPILLGIGIGSFVTAAMILGQKFHGIATNKAMREELDAERAAQNKVSPK